MSVTVNATTNVVTSTAAETAYSGRCFLDYIHWRAVTTAAHDLIVKSGGGDVLVTHKAQAANDFIILPVMQWVDGIVTDTIDSGEVDYHLG